MRFELQRRLGPDNQSNSWENDNATREISGCSQASALPRFLSQSRDCHALAQAAAALSGQVSSAEEGTMEGVLVSAKKEGSTITVTVVSDDKGHYSFPADRLEPGKYTITIRAVGYDLDGPKSVDVAAGQAPRPTSSSSRPRISSNQLSNAEWLISAPGPDAVKKQPAAIAPAATRCSASSRLDARRRRVPADLQAHGHLFAGHHADPSAAAAAGTARRASARSPRTQTPADRELARQRQPEHNRTARIRRSRRCRARRAAPPTSSSPNTICRAKKRSRMT